eukprot:TRINITY_DN111638_c0_g1_i1.p1 TRINITY_DN111638_c0_g1~~TRINITY_DN111638_c0_g1_i1.p1  ORF type:complete len:203 (+),score=32.54 TRINITY_DN111638_c0_g1_i1:117-725(+)
MAKASILKGKCLCGGVEYQVVNPDMRQLLVCQCSLCRKQTGALSIAFGAFKRTSVEFVSRTTLKCLHASDVADRGFCSGCGGLVFMDYLAKEPNTIWLSFGLMESSLLARMVEDYEKRLDSVEKDDTSDIVYKPSEVFSQSKCRILHRFLSSRVPEANGFGAYVQDCCAEVEVRKEGSWTADEDLVALVNKSDADTSAEAGF